MNLKNSVYLTFLKIWYKRNMKGAIREKKLNVQVDYRISRLAVQKSNQFNIFQRKSKEQTRLAKISKKNCKKVNI